MRLFVLLVTAAALPASAQDRPPSPDPSKPTVLIQGTVVDKDTHAAVTGAQVAVVPSKRGELGAVIARAGESGNFEVRANSSERLSITASAPGYQSGAAVAQIGAGQSSVFVEVPLMKLQSLGGVLVDDETGEPIGGLVVELTAPGNGFITGDLLMRGLDKTVSAADGSFSLPQIPRGEYFLRISAKPAPVIGKIPAKELRGDGRDKALEAPAGVLGYGTIVWPGRTADIPAEPGIKVGATPVNVGEIRISRNKLVNLSGLIAPCEEGASIQVNLSRPSATAVEGMRATTDLTCGDGFQLLNLPEGTFTVTAIQGFPQRRWVSQSIDARMRSPLRLTLAAFVSVRIDVEAEGATTERPPENIRFTLTPDNRAVKVDTPSQLHPGAFEATLYPGEHYWLSAALPPKYYVKRIAYDGQALPDFSGFTASSGSVSHLGVVLSEHAATVEVQLTSGGRSLKDRPQILLLRDRMSFAELSRDFPRYMRPAFSTGTISFAGLPPGTYRAVRTDSDQPLPTTEALFQAMLADPSRQSTPVTVDEGQTATISWDLP